MKRTLYILLGLIAGICISCKKDEPVIDINTVAPELIGEWHLIEEKCDGEVVKSMADVYLCISDRTFELYQKSGSQTRYFKFNGICYSEDEKLIGQYHDGTPWGTVYIVSFTEGKLILSTYDNMGEMTYERKALADEDKNNASVVVKSSAAESPIL